jgi:hypothetical protein
MSFSTQTPPPSPPPEPYVSSAAVRAYLGGVSAHTIQKWLALGMPCRRVPSERGGRLMFKLSEVDAWLDFYQSNRTANTPGHVPDTEDVA